MGKTEKNQKENHVTKVTKMPEDKSQKYGMNKTLGMSEFLKEQCGGHK
jgi:hypothetical protein